ncbi:MAG: M13 family metallopeptidase N-terminal domain-containing protein [Vicinamibacterales bacterium]
MPTSIRSTPRTSTPTTCSASSSRRTSTSRRETRPTSSRADSPCPIARHYISTSPGMVDVQKQYLAHVATLLTLAGARETDAQRQAARIVALETKIARTHATREQSVDVHRANNPWPRDDFDRKAPGLDWTAFFDAAALSAQPAFIVWHPGAVTGTSALVASQPLDDWKIYLRYSVLNHWASLLPKAFASEDFAFFGTTLSGTPQQAERWRRGVRRRKRWATPSDACTSSSTSLLTRRKPSKGWSPI